MSGGYWGKGNNPYFNYDFDAAARDTERHASNDIANRARKEVENQKQSHESDISRLRVQMNSTITSHKKVVSEYEERLDRMKIGLYKIAMRANIFQRTLLKLQEKWPEKKEDILDEIQKQRDFCATDEYSTGWWNWANDFQKNPNPDEEYFSFPFEKRQLKR